MPQAPMNRDRAPDEVRFAGHLRTTRLLQKRLFAGDKSEETKGRLRQAEHSLDTFADWVRQHRPDKSPIGRMAILAQRMRASQRVFLSGKHSPALIAECRGVEREVDALCEEILSGPGSRQGDLFASPGVALIGEVVDRYASKRGFNP